MDCCEPKWHCPENLPFLTAIVWAKVLTVLFSLMGPLVAQHPDSSPHDTTVVEQSGGLASDLSEIKGSHGDSVPSDDPIIRPLSPVASLIVPGLTQWTKGEIAKGIGHMGVGILPLFALNESNWIPMVAFEAVFHFHSYRDAMKPVQSPPEDYVGKELVRARVLPSKRKVKGKREKSMLKAFLLSALMPGTGQFYAKGKSAGKRALAYLAFEAGSIGTYAYTRAKAQNALDESRQFAQWHYSDSAYQAWVDWQNSRYAGTGGGSWIRRSDSLYQEAKNHYPEEYYRLVGDGRRPFVRGWSDVEPSLPLLERGNLPDSIDGKAVESNSATGFILGDEFVYGYSKYQREYIELRAKSSKFRGRAMNIAAFLALNHFISAIDAAITVYMDRHEESSWRRKIDVGFAARRDSRGEPSPHLTLGFTF